MWELPGGMRRGGRSSVGGFAASSFYSEGADVGKCRVESSKYSLSWRSVEFYVIARV